MEAFGNQYEILSINVAPVENGCFAPNPGRHYGFQKKTQEPEELCLPLWEDVSDTRKGKMTFILN